VPFDDRPLVTHPGEQAHAEHQLAASAKMPGVT
jgi:hypothetical protein